MIQDVRSYFLVLFCIYSTNTSQSALRPQIASAPLLFGEEELLVRNLNWGNGDAFDVQGGQSPPRKRQLGRMPTIQNLNNRPLCAVLLQHAVILLLAGRQIGFSLRPPLSGFWSLVSDLWSLAK